jgi:2-dehydropantoate 2-reductase
VFNSICPLLDVDNGLFFRNEAAKLLAIGIIGECVAVANEAGVTLDPDGVLETVLLISKSSEGQLISTLQDIKNKRQTEIESLNFAVAEIARKSGKPELSIMTKLLGDLTRLKSTLAMEI